jgi:predicted nuclease with TOPRIM domain
MQDFVIKYLELYTLQQQSKEQLISKIMELQARDQELVEKITELHESKRESAKLHREELKRYEERFENIFTLHAKNEIVTEEYKKLIDLKLGNTYKINDTWVNKIVFVLKAAGRPLRSSEIIDILKKNDITLRTLTDPQKGLSAHLTKALKYGRIIGTKQKGQNGYVFELPQ